MGKLSRSWRIGAALTVVALAAAACGGSSKPTPTGSGGTPSKAKVGGTATFAIDETIPGFNVNTSADNEFVLQEALNQVWPQPFIITPGLKPQLDTDYVLSAKETSTSPETIVYKLNPKAVWSDGMPVNADDWIYNWQAQSGQSQYTDVGGKPFDDVGTTGYANIQSVTGSNNGHTVTVVFQKDNPYGDWQGLFGDLVPAHVAKVAGWNTGFNDWTKVISAGPFEFQNYVKDQTLTEARNPKWWGTKANLSTITYRILADDSAGPTALQNNEVQVFYPSSPTKAIVDQVKALPNVTAVTPGGLEFEHLDFNQVNFYLAKLPVRQAIAYGIDRSQLIARTVGQITSGIKPLGNRIFVPGQPQYQDNNGPYATADPAKAKSLLQSAGMTMGTDGYFHPTSGPLSGQDLAFTLSTTTGQPLRQNSEEVIQSELKAVGIKINIQNYPAATLFGTNLPKGQYDIAEFAWVDTPFASGNLSIYCSYTEAQTCGQNWVHYANPALDSILTKASKQPTASAAADYNKADKILWDDMVTLPLFQKPQLQSWSDKYTNIVPNTASVGITWNANDWALKAS